MENAQILYDALKDILNESHKDGDPVFRLMEIKYKAVDAIVTYDEAEIVRKGK